MKANAAKGESLRELRYDDAQSKPDSEIDKNVFKSFLDKPGFPVATSASFGTSSFGASSFGTSGKPGSLFNNNSPFTFGGILVVDNLCNSSIPFALFSVCDYRHWNLVCGSWFAFLLIFHRL